VEREEEVGVRAAADQVVAGPAELDPVAAHQAVGALEVKQVPAAVDREEEVGVQAAVERAAVAVAVAVPMAVLVGAEAEEAAVQVAGVLAADRAAVDPAAVDPAAVVPAAALVGRVQEAAEGRRCARACGPLRLRRDSPLT